jgi:hypothetical protein
LALRVTRNFLEVDEAACLHGCEDLTQVFEGKEADFL